MSRLAYAAHAFLGDGTRPVPLPPRLERLLERLGMSRLALLLRAVTYARYFAASAGALAIDYAVFLLFLAAPLPAPIASGMGYAVGVAMHWWLSTRIVFADRVADAGPERVTQQALFLGSALAGLLVTMGVVGLGQVLGLDPRVAKLAATAVSFNAVWLIRRYVVFA